MYQRKVDVDMLNAVKSVLAGVSSEKVDVTKDPDVTPCPTVFNFVIVSILQ